MARRSRGYSRQRQLEQELKAALAELKSTRETLREAQKQAEKSGRFGRIPKIPNADYRKMLRLEKRLGLYEPETTALTPARKRTIRQRFLELERLTKTSVFAEYPQGTTKTTRQTIKRNVRKFYPNQPERLKKQKTNKRGIFLPRSERQMIAPVGRLHFDRKTGIWLVQTRRKTKSGLYAVENRPISGSDILERKQAQIEKYWLKQRPLKSNQRLRFIVGQHESRRTFRSMAELFRYAARYRRDDQARFTFLNELIIETVQKGKPRLKWIGKGKRRHQVKDPWTVRSSAVRASNLHHMPTDFIDDMFEEMDDVEE